MHNENFKHYTKFMFFNSNTDHLLLITIKKQLHYDITWIRNIMYKGFRLHNDTKEPYLIRRQCIVKESILNQQERMVNLLSQKYRIFHKLGFSFINSTKGLRYFQNVSLLCLKLWRNKCKGAKTAIFSFQIEIN